MGGGSGAGPQSPIPTAFRAVQVRMRIALECPVDSSIVACLANIGRNEGVRALYYGLPATVAGIIPFSSMKLATCAPHMHMHTPHATCHMPHATCIHCVCVRTAHPLSPHASTAGDVHTACCGALTSPSASPSPSPPRPPSPPHPNPGCRYDMLRRRLTEGVDAASVSVSLAQSVRTHTIHAPA